MRQKPIQMEASIGLSYPGLRFAVHVQRKSGYYVINVVCPTGLFALLCGCQAWIPRANVADRLSVSLTLLLTATAYKFVTASMLPAVAYQTFLDKYVSMCSIIIILMVLEAPLASNWSNNFDVVSMCIILGMWFVIQIWYTVRVFQFHRETARQMHLKNIAETIRQQQSTKLQQRMSQVAAAVRIAKLASANVSNVQVAPNLASIAGAAKPKPSLASVAGSPSGSPAAVKPSDA